jgi:putative chitinase
MSIISISVLLAGTGAHAEVADGWLAPMQDACERFGISTPNSVAAFLANVGVESAGLTAFVENMNYSAIGLANTWPSRYADDHQSVPIRPNALAVSISRNPQKIANNVYADRLGNGDVASGDGWRYRGQGPIQITGKANFSACGAAIGIDLITSPELLQQPGAGALSAAWFFSSRGCIALAEVGDIAGVVRAINGADPCPANQGQLRISRYGDALAVLNAST